MNAAEKELWRMSKAGNLSAVADLLFQIFGMTECETIAALLHERVREATGEGPRPPF